MTHLWQLLGLHLLGFQNYILRSTKCQLNANLLVLGLEAKCKLHYKYVMYVYMPR